MPLPTNDSAPTSANSGDNSSSLGQIWQSRKRLLLAALLIAVTLLLYGPVQNHKFINFDDDQYVTANQHVLSGFSPENIRWAFGTFEMGLWHPLTWFSHMLDSQLFGLNAGGHHYSSLLLHAINVFLLFWLLNKATGSAWRSFFVAAFFAVHPLNVESVAWVAERKTLLSAFFCFLMLGLYGWYARAASWTRYLAVVVVFVLAIMAKAMAVTMPVALLLFDYWPLGRFALDNHSPASPVPLRRRASRLVLEKLPLLLISAVASFVAVIAQRSTGSLDTAMSLRVRLANAAVAYVAYLGKAFWPTRLSIYYPHPQSSISLAQVGLALLILVAITAAAVKLRRQQYLAVGWLFYLITLLPVIGIVQIGGQAMADRYTYTPLIGVFLIVVWGAAELRERLRIPPAAMAAVALCALASLAVVTRATLAYWQDSLTLFTRAELLASPPDKVIETNLGEALNDAGLPEQAIQHFERALSLDPHCALALYDVGCYRMQRGEARESIPNFEAAILYSRSKPLTDHSLHNLGSAFLVLGDYSHAERAYSAVLQDNANSYLSLIGRGQAFYGDAKFAEAAADFTRALRLRPDPKLFLWLGKALEGEQKFDQALAAYTATLDADPASAEAKARMTALRARLSASTPPLSSVH